MRQTGIAGVLCIVLFIGAAGCAGWFKNGQEKTATELAEEGDAYFQEQEYNKAIKAYQRLKDWYPYSPYAKKAELRIADAQYNLEEYAQALAAYEHYERMHPGDPKIPYVIYRIGMCHYKRIRSIDRTQVPTRKALDAFMRLKSRFAESEYAQKAVAKIETCRKNLAGHNFYVGRFYFKSEHFRAALARFESVVDKYPDAEEYSSKARNYVEQCKELLAKKEKRSGGKGDDFLRRPTESSEAGLDIPQPTPGQ